MEWIACDERVIRVLGSCGVSSVPHRGPDSPLYRPRGGDRLMWIEREKQRVDMGFNLFLRHTARASSPASPAVVMDDGEIGFYPSVRML